MFLFIGKSRGDEYLLDENSDPDDVGLKGGGQSIHIPPLKIFDIDIDANLVKTLKKGEFTRKDDVRKDFKDSGETDNNGIRNGIGDTDENGDMREEKLEEEDETEISNKLSIIEIAEEKTVDKKPTHKEKKKIKKLQEYEKQMETLLKKGGQGHSELDSNFTVSQMQKTAGQMAALENAVDIKIENFSISAKGNELFVNANLLIAQGRHYGLVGPNG